MDGERERAGLAGNGGERMSDSGYWGITRKPGTCCPEPTCDHKVAPVKCEGCGATCPCPAWEMKGVMN